MTHKINVIPNDKNAKVYYKGEGEATYKEENCSDLQDTGGILDEQVSAFV